MTTRREVLHTIGLAAAVTLIPGCGGGDGDASGVPTGKATMCGANLCLLLSENSELQAVDGIMFFPQAPGKKLFVQRTSDTTFQAMSAVCTHAGCTVAFNGTDKFNCPCHGSSFSSAGAVLNGPAGTPLRIFPTALAGDELTITL
ncbi:MAG: iron-sulfur protein (secreted protein) [Deltaproteobacteria bacterium]|nr:iron-sulfur protein (secreted protein) [Deltaproteobacteria bacterium]